MNLPNKLTVVRAALVPVFIVFMLVPMFGNPACTGAAAWIAAAIFVIASLTDLLDGKIARKYNLVTDFGKFMDPIADKLLVCSGFICLVSLERIQAWMVILIIAREFIIGGLREVAADNGVVIAASYWGKFKTAFSMIAVGLLILIEDFHAMPIPEPFWTIINLTTQIVVWVSVILTVISLVDYLVKNRKVLKSYK